MTVKELYELCSNWLPNTMVSVGFSSFRDVEVFTHYSKVIELYGDRLVANFCWFSRENVFVINLR